MKDDTQPNLFKLVDPEIHYADLDLSPLLSLEITNMHKKLHQKYYLQTKKTLEREQFKEWDLNLLLSYTRREVYNNAAQYWLHNMYWDNLTKNKTEPGVYTKAQIIKDYNSLESFKSCFIATSLNRFGSGWYVLGFHRHYSPALRCMTFTNAKTPMSKNIIPILLVDLFEHSYILQYGIDKTSYLEAIWTLINWDEVERRLSNYKTDYQNFKNWT